MPFLLFFLTILLLILLKTIWSPFFFISFPVFPSNPSRLRCSVSLPVVTYDQLHGIQNFFELIEGLCVKFLLLFWEIVVLSWCLSSLNSTLYSLILIFFLSAGSTHMLIKPIPKQSSVSDRPLTCIQSKIFEILFHSLNHLISFFVLS